jgi:hypothetical protein
VISLKGNGMPRFQLIKAIELGFSRWRSMQGLFSRPLELNG